MNSTHIGSLPFHNFTDAYDQIIGLSYFTLPELVANESELMMNKGVLALVEKDFFKLIPHINESVFEKTNLKNLIVHVVGPMTLFTYSKNPQAQIDRMDEYFELLHNLDLYLNDRFKGVDIFICLDEPGLNYFDFSIKSDSDLYLNSLKKFKSKIGIHCCDDFDAIQDYAFHLDFISFPFFENDFEKLKKMAKENPQQLFFCGVFDWESGERFSKDELKKYSNLIPNIVWTPDCGLGLKTVNEAKMVINYLRGLV